MNEYEANRLDAHELRRVATAAECDPRTVKRYLDGKEIEPMNRRRIERALDRLNGASPPPMPPSSPPAALKRGATSPEALAERQVLALESIAASLEKLANPPVVVKLEPRPSEVDELERQP